MKTLRYLTSICCLACTSFAQEAGYEAAPLLQAKAILKPEILAGPHHKVLDTVTTHAGRNSYTIETPWGYLAADGDAMLLARVAEVHATAELSKISLSEEFKTGLKNAAKTPVKLAKGLVEDPADTLKGTAKGVMKFLGRAKTAVKNVATGQERPAGADNLGKEMLGFSKAKRALALQLGADPYSTNEIFQEQLHKVAWVNTAGNGVFQIATLPIGGGVGLALTAAEVSASFQQSLRDLSPTDLRVANEKRLAAMQIAPALITKFLGNQAFSPTNATALVQALEALKGVENRGALLVLAADTATEEADAVFCSHTAQLLATLHLGKDKIARLTTLGDLPVAITADGRLLIALQWDTAFWSETVEEFVNAAAAAKLGQTGAVHIAITGSATAKTKVELERRGLTLHSGVLNGPQK